jgi:predicted Zn finger-like uncharacterized protein
MHIPLECPHCGAPESIDPAHIPRFGARVRCVSCRELYDLPRPESVNGGEPGTAENGDGRMNHLDPGNVARMIVLDILYSDETRVVDARRRGRVLLDLRDEIDAAFSTYRSRVGADVAATEPHFRDAVIAILLRGEEPD